MTTPQAQASILATRTKDELVATCTPGPGFLQHKANEVILQQCCLNQYATLAAAVRADYIYLPAAVQLAVNSLEQALANNK
jgi:hypothetical protein